MISYDSFALSIMYDAENVPVCLALTGDSIAESIEDALTAEWMKIEGENLLIGKAGEAVINLPGLSPVVAEAFGLGLPLVILDPSSGREHLIPSSVAR